VVLAEVRLAHFTKDGKTRIGIVKNDSIFDLGRAASKLGIADMEGIGTIDMLLSREGMLDLVKRSEPKLLTLDSPVPLASVKLQSPILSPEKIYCAAINYVSHSKEQDVKPPSLPYFFTKFRNAIVGPEDPILLPRISKKVDWEVELAVVIARKGKYIPKEGAMDYVAGYTIANDVSFRDLQFPEGWPQKVDPLGHNWVKGKGLDNALPLGPWLVTSDELKNPYDSRISLSVNGVTRQDSVIGEMVFKIDRLIEYASQGVTLSPGDVISTGTPLGVAAFTGAPYLKEGDVVEAEIGRIGKLRNIVKPE
jgi:2-keto-4-pentenoate hydratase/2-oxohepta-3-ene-1,7-dioic acid hydratase in catechol pathway